MQVADGYSTKFNTEAVRIQLCLLNGESEIATLILEKDEMERLIFCLRDSMEKAEGKPRRQKHSWWGGR